MTKDMRPGMRSFLLADSAISAKVAGARIYPDKMPEGVNDISVVYNRISGRSGHHMGGRDGLAFARIQIDAWAPDKGDDLGADQALALADLIKDRIDGYSGVMGTGGDVVTVQGVFVLDEKEMFDASSKLHGMSRDYLFVFVEL